MALWSTSASNYLDARQSTGALAWPVAPGLYKRGCSSRSLSYSPFLWIAQDLPSLLNSPMLFPQRGGVKCCTSHFSCLIQSPCCILLSRTDDNLPNLLILCSWKQVEVIWVSPQKLLVWRISHKYAIFFLTAFPGALPHFLSLFLFPYLQKKRDNKTTWNIAYLPFEGKEWLKLLEGQGCFSLSAVWSNCAGQQGGLYLLQRSPMKHLSSTLFWDVSHMWYHNPVRPCFDKVRIDLAE